MGTDQLKWRGFTLVEVLIAMVILTVAAVALLQGFGFAVRSYSSAHERWRTALESWNRCIQARVDAPAEFELVHIIPECRPLYRILITDDFRQWEVLRAEK